MSGTDTQIEENVLISSEEVVLMQTATTENRNSNHSCSARTRLLLDSGSQRTYITEALAKKLNLKGENEQEIKLATFGSDKTKLVKTKQRKLSIKLQNITANIVPVISSSVQRRSIKLQSQYELRHILSSLNLADTVPTENESSTVDLLIENDYYLGAGSDKKSCR